jgi:transposase
MRRVACNNCGVKVEQVPWAEGKSPLTYAFKQFLAFWARRLSWQETARIYSVSWASVKEAVKWVVDYGLKHLIMDGIKAIGVDEIHFQKGSNFITLVYQIENMKKRLLYVGKDRNVKSLLRFFHDLGKARCSSIRYICSDMWKPYLKVIAKKCSSALHILDRFHIVANLNKALNEVRATEAREMHKAGYSEVLKNTRYCFLKNPENLTPNQEIRLRDVLKYNLKSVRAYLLKESFQAFWKYISPVWAGWYLDQWYTRAVRSRLKPMIKVARSIHKHKPLILNWFKANKMYSSGTVEGLNRKVNLVTRKSYGFKSFENLQLALYHNLGDLPEPPTTHRFF